MTPDYKFYIPKGTQRKLYVCKDTHEAVCYFAHKYKMRIYEATQYLLTKALREEFGLIKKDNDNQE